ncbi:PAS/PAC sensor signal transduction histidine kinase [Candidatus Halobonum tyrrellensis G22]|uniref:histidine kinase n=2 Tax=Candidatus Halobonum TaxID=1431544 RepID=V4GWT9_9EURY|nr:PAS/PAC sensor signal transduction histidine kinase [Candidatus Halobonum tyrrellensis G22]
MAVAAAVACAVGVALWRHREDESGVYLALLLFALTVWSGAYAAGYARADLAGKLLASRVAYVGVGLTPVLWTVFAASYGRQVRLTRGRVLAVAAPLVVTAAATWVSPAVPLMWAAVRLEATATGVYFAPVYGPLFWLHAVYSYLLLLVGSVLFAATVVSTTGTHRAQAAGLLCVVAVPWLANATYLGGLFPPGFDPTPLAFVVSGLLIAAMRLNYRLLDASPATRGVARDAAVEGMDDPVFVLREDGTVTDCNPAGAAVAGSTRRELLGRPLADALPDLHEVVTAPVDADHERPAYVRSTDGGDRVYDARVSRFSRGGLVGGRIVTLRDVTERRRHERRLSVLNRVLRHDLRNDINVVVGYTELLDPVADDAADLRPVERIRERAEGMLTLTEKVREVEATLDTGEKPLGVVELGGVLRDVASAARADFPEATVELDAPDSLPVRGIEFLDSVFDNLVENAIEHHDGDHPHVRVTARQADGCAEVTVTDDGPGLPESERRALACDRESQLEHASGFGLWLVTWLVEESDGDIRFDTDDGTTVTVRLPAADGGSGSRSGSGRG